jgi:hypothetical protein
MIRDLWEKQRPLLVAGLVSLLCGAILSIVSLFDPTQVLGLNRWIKPIKFFTSITIFVWTIAVYLNFLKNYEKTGPLISWTMIGVFLIEMVIIVMQAARGTTSHFNIATPRDGMLFSIMGLAIVINTLLVGHLLFLYLTAVIDLPKTILWGMRLGLIVFLLGSIEGGYMSAQLGHTVGLADGGRGLPFVNWSTEGGDLRIAHFFGLHAIQAIPICAYFLERFKVRSATTLIFLFAFAYFAFFTFVFIQALNAQPFLRF